MSQVLIVEDDARVGRALRRVLRAAGFEAEHEDDPERALERLREAPVEVIITDVRMPGIDGIELLRRCKTIRPTCEVVVVTAYASVPLAREALLLGAADFLTKPFSPEKELVPLIERLLSVTAEEEPGPDGEEEEIVVEPVGESGPLREALEVARRIADSDASVLLRGESGTGKEVFANFIHRHSRRAQGPFVKVNCAALPAALLESELFGHRRGAFTGAERDRVGLFESAHGGTLLLDEVGEIPIELQPKLLRVLQDGEFHRVGDPLARRADVRILAATNRSLEEAIAERRFRSDLFYRLAVVPLTIPPLRERIEDMPALVQHTAAALGVRQPVVVEPEADRRLREHPWPGNIRELANAVEHALVLGDGRRIRLEDLPASLRRPPEGAPGSRERGAPASPPTLEELEKRSIVQALQRTGGNRTRAARLLGVTRRTLGYRIQKYGLERTLASVRPEPREGERRGPAMM